jgi:hypothetical protein
MPEPLRFLISDELHIHRRSFESLFAFIKAQNIATTAHRAYPELKNALGDYRDQPALTAYTSKLSGLDERTLFTLTHSYRSTRVALFPLYRAEALSLMLTRNPSWHASDLERDDALLFARMYANEHELLVANAAAAMFWIDEYARFFGAFRGTYSHAFVFGGSLIYTRVLTELCKRSETHCIALESSFTGHQYYAEQRYSPLTSSPDIRLPTVRSALWSGHVASAQQELRSLATRLMFEARNKNVVQPKDDEPLTFAEPQRRELLIVGQVVNDFSIIENPRCPLSTIAFYKGLISRCLADTDYNIVFKAHPWEQRKQHVRQPFTLNELAAFRLSLPKDWQHRLQLVSSANLLALGRRVHQVALLNSQAGLELAFHCGLRVHTFGDPYYAEAGFSRDHAGEASLAEFSAELRASTDRAVMSLDEYDRLLDFLACFLRLSCVSTDESGIQQLRDRLQHTHSEPVPLHKSDTRRFERLIAKSQKLLRDPRRFVRDSRFLRRLTKTR